MTRVAVLGLALSAAIFGADSKDVNRTVALPTNGLVDIETHKGSIRVSVWDRQEVEIQARIEAEPGTEMDRRRFDGTEVRIDSSAESVRIKTYYPDFNWCCSFDNGTNPEVRYTIKMPNAARLVIRGSSFRYQSTGLRAHSISRPHRGSAHIRGLGGALHLDTYRGRRPSRVFNFHRGQQREDLSRERRTFDAQEQPVRSPHELRTTRINLHRLQHDRPCSQPARRERPWSCERRRAGATPGGRARRSPSPRKVVLCGAG